VGRSPITSNQFSSVRRNIPLGLPKPVAIFARTLLSPMPTEQCSRVAASTTRCASCATDSGSAVVTPRKHSSHPSTSSTTPGSARSVSITSVDARS
jgi:hydroxymethylglutaryl-CoA reductase